MELRGRHVTLRPTTLADAPALAAILAQPEVARWWGAFDLERVITELVEGDPEEDPFVIEHGGEIVGYIQAVEEHEPDFRHAGIDLFLRTDTQGRGLPPYDRPGGRQRAGDRGLHEARVPPGRRDAALPAVTNGLWVDALLMDLLADELVRWRSRGKPNQACQERLGR